MLLFAHVQFQYRDAVEVAIAIARVELYHDIWTTDPIAQPYWS